MANDFVSGRVMRALKILVHSEEYVAVHQGILAREKELHVSLNADERELWDEIDEQQKVLSCQSEEACYLQGFRDVVRLMAGLPLE